MKTTQSDIIHCFLLPYRRIMLTNTLGEVKEERIIEYCLKVTVG